MKRHHLTLILLAGLGLLPAKASSTLTIVLDSPTLIGAPGGSVEFTGTITNTTGDEIFLNADSFTLATFDPSAIDDSPFFTNAPLSLVGFDLTGDIGLFNVNIPALFPEGGYFGTFQILGGLDGDAQEQIGSVDFTVQVQQPSGVPEPSAGLMLSAGLGLLLIAKRFRSALIAN
jgi:hypothetical protein